MRIHENTDNVYTWLEYTEDEFFKYLEDIKKYSSKGELVHEYKLYGQPFYYLIISNQNEVKA